MSRKLSPEEHQRRGTYRPHRHRDDVKTALAVTDLHENWLSDLSLAAQWHGRTMLERCVVTDREAFRAYLTAFIEWAALPRTRATPVELLQHHFMRASQLLAATKWRWR